jgi:hypothetical protein
LIDEETMDGTAEQRRGAERRKTYEGDRERERARERERERERERDREKKLENVKEELTQYRIFGVSFKL